MLCKEAFWEKECPALLLLPSHCQFLWILIAGIQLKTFLWQSFPLIPDSEG